MFEQFVEAIKRETGEAEPEDVHNSPLEAVRTETTDASLESQEYRKQLLEAISEKNPDKVLTLIMNGNKENAKTLRTLNDECRAVSLRQKQRSCCIKNICNTVSACIKNIFCKQRYCWSPCKQCCKDEQQPTEDQIEEERQWIEILSNPLYISLEWLYRIYSKSSRKESTEGRCSIKPTTEAFTVVVIEPSDEDENGKNQDGDAHALKPLPDVKVSNCPKDEGRANEDENLDVIASALRDSHLLEMIAGNDLHQHKDEYEKRANEVEEFAVAVVEGSTREQLIDVMDTKGDGCLRQQNPWNFSQSLSLLKIAADEERKKVGEFLFVTAPCSNKAQNNSHFASLRALILSLG